MSDQEQPKIIRNVDFTLDKIGVTEAILENGTRVKVQIVPLSFGLTDKTMEDGQPLYLAKFQHIINQFPPEDRIKPAALKKEV